MKITGTHVQEPQISRRLELRKGIVGVRGTIPRTSEYCPASRIYGLTRISQFGDFWQAQYKGVRIVKVGSLIIQYER